MRKLSGHRVGIDQGEVSLFNDYEADGPMWSGSGQRAVVKTIKLKEAFAERPSVTLTLAMCDMSNDAFLRFSLHAETVKNDGFEIHFETWGDTKIARVRVAWQAIGEVSSDEDWDV